MTERQHHLRDLVRFSRRTAEHRVQLATFWPMSGRSFYLRLEDDFMIALDWTFELVDTCHAGLTHRVSYSGHWLRSQMR